MTSEPDNTSGRRPPTIELKATEVEAETPAAAPETAATAPVDGPAETPDQQASSPQAAEEETINPAADDRPGGLLKSSAVGGFVGAVTTAAIVAGLWFAGFGLAREMAPGPSSVASPSAALSPSAGSTQPTRDAETAARLDKIERTIQAQRPEPALGNRLAAAESQAKSLADSLAALNHRVDDMAASSQRTAAQADAATAASDAAKSADQTTVQHGDIDALASRIAALDGAVKALSDNVTHRAASADDQPARLTIAAQALRAAVERGVPYQAEIKAVAALGADPNETAPLEPFAASGLPSAEALGHELAALVPTLERASGTAPNETSVLEKLKANAQKLVRITPVDAPAGNNPAAVIARLGIDAAHADIAAALTDIAALPEAAKPLAADWVKKAETRNAAITASRQIAADALAVFSKPAAQ
jgi:hypothetical protein